MELIDLRQVLVRGDSDGQVSIKNSYLAIWIVKLALCVPTARVQKSSLHWEGAV